MVRNVYHCIAAHLFSEVVDLISEFEVVWKAIRQDLSSFGMWQFCQHLKLVISILILNQNTIINY